MWILLAGFRVCLWVRRGTCHCQSIDATINGFEKRFTAIYEQRYRFTVAILGPCLDAARRMRLFPTGAASSRSSERRQRQSDLRSQRGSGLSSLRRCQSKDGKPHQQTFTTVALDVHVFATAGAGDEECNRHPRARTDEPSQNPPAPATAASNFFFTDGTFSNQSLLVGWEHDHIPPTVNALLASYHGDDQPAPKWPDDDYDTVWTVKLDANGNSSIDNATCEGIASAKLPATPPQFR